MPMSKMGLRTGGERKADGGWSGEAGRFQSGIWEQGGTVLCLLASAHTNAKLNSNKIRHRCGSDFNCPQPVLRPGHMVLKGGWSDSLTTLTPLPALPP